MNNFEKIKQMNIDEMASWITDFVENYTRGSLLNFDEILEVLLESEVEE